MSDVPGKRHRAARYVHLSIGLTFYAIAALACALMFRSLWVYEWWHAALALVGAALANNLGMQFIRHQNKLDEQDEAERKTAEGA